MSAIPPTKEIRERCGKFTEEHPQNRSDALWLIVGSVRCCALAVRGQTTADPAIPLMKSRRRIAFPGAQDHAYYVNDYSRD